MEIVPSFHGNSVLITGGTGSFGSTMAKELLSQEVGEIVILSRDEAKQDQMRLAFRDHRLRFVIGDTRDFEKVRQTLRGVDFVFHAAALKQVPSAEFFPEEAVKTNFVGSSNVLRASVEAGVKSVVCLSTDKAVYPINAMGMTKALMEKLAVAVAREHLATETRICVTRYGNVMFSRGSVIPKFIDQILRNEPISVTDPNMTRFLMSLDESVDLVRYAFLEGKSGDTLVRKAPAATLRDLVSALENILDKRAVGIETIGFRHGEKLFEALLSSEEVARASDEGSYFVVPMDERSLNYEPYFERGHDRPSTIDPYTSHNTTRLTVPEIEKALLNIPEVREIVGN